MADSYPTHRLRTLTNETNDPRAKLDIALRHVSQWSDQDRHFFVVTFTSNRSEPELAQMLGLSTGVYQTRRRELLRRFMHAAQTKTPISAACA